MAAAAVADRPSATLASSADHPGSSSTSPTASAHTASSQPQRFVAGSMSEPGRAPSGSTLVPPVLPVDTALPSGTGGPSAHEPAPVQPMPWAKSSGRQQLKAQGQAPPSSGPLSPQAPSTHEGGIPMVPHGATPSPYSSPVSRRNMRRRSTGEADVLAAVTKLQAATELLLNPLPLGQRPPRLHIVEDPDDALLPNQAPHQGPGNFSVSSPHGASTHLSPLARMLQAQSGMASARQRRGSSQPQASSGSLGAMQPVFVSRPDHSYSRDLEEEARLQATKASLMASSGVSRSSLPGSGGGRSGSYLQAGSRRSMTVDTRSAYGSVRGGPPSGELPMQGREGRLQAEHGASGSGRDSPRGNQTLSFGDNAYERQASASIPASPEGGISPHVASPSRFDPSGQPGSSRTDGGQGGRPVGVGGNPRSGRRMSQTTGGSQRTVAGVAGVDPTTARRRSRIFDVLPDLMPLLDGDHTSPSGHGASGKLLLQVKELRHDLEESQRENMRLKERAEDSERRLRQSQRELEHLRQTLQQERQAGLWLRCMPFLRRSAIHSEDSDYMDDLPVSSKMPGAGS